MDDAAIERSDLLVMAVLAPGCIMGMAVLADLFEVDAYGETEET